MANWHQVLAELRRGDLTIDGIRRKYIRQLAEYTNRNTIVYYSGWLQKWNIPKGLEINDEDITGLMSVIHELEKERGLDLVLHTPGGEVAATEAIVEYMRSIFGNNMRAIVPQMAMSGGTMIACATKEILMGKHSSLGPIDPLLSGLAAHGIIEEFDTAYKEIQQDQSKLAVWAPILQKYHPTLLGEAEKSIKWANEITSEWLKTGMFIGLPEKEAGPRIKRIVDELSDHTQTKAHARHITAQKAETLGLKIIHLESDQELQDRVLSLHHACVHTLKSTGAYKIIENQNDIAFIQMVG